MISIARSLPRQLSQVGQCFSVSMRASGQRNFFSPSYFGIESFKNYSNTIEKEHGQNSSSLKVSIEEALSKPETKVFTEDLKVLLYLTKSDADINLLINAIKKYQKQESSAIFSFNFETPLMRLLYSMNKTDKALELFLVEGETILHKFFTAGTILINKLLEEKRYDDAIKIVNKIINKFRVEKKADPNNRLKTMDLSNLAAEALLGKNNAEAFEQAKDLIKSFKELDLELHDNAYIKIFLLAHNQNQVDFAYELTSRVKNKSQNVVNNLKILTLVKLNRLEEALNLAEETNKLLNKGPENRLFFKEILNCIEELGQHSSDKQKKFQDLAASIKNENKLIDLSLMDYALKLNEKKMKRDPQGNQGNFSSNRPEQQEGRNQNYNRQYSNQNRQNYSNKNQNRGAQQKNRSQEE